MTEQEIVTYVETYINNVTSLAQSLCWCYFLAGILFSVCFYEFLDLLFKKLGKDKKKQDKKSKKEEVEK